MLNFPVPYPEELLYSTIARAGIRLGLTSPKQLLDAVFGTRTVIATLDIPNHISLISKKLPEKYRQEILIYQHTLFPLYAPFIPENRRQQCITWMCGESHGSVHLAVGVAASHVPTPVYTRYCPLCVQQQRKDYGEYFWKREWQVSGIDACPEHGALINTAISRPFKDRHHFIAASPAHCSEYVSKIRFFNTAAVMYQVRLLLSGQARPSPTYAQWTSYYCNLAKKTGFTHKNHRINYKAIGNKVLASWPIEWLKRHRLVFTEGSESSWITMIFRKHRKSFNYLQHIIIHQALLEKFWNINEVIDDARQFICNPKVSKPLLSCWPGKPLSPEQIRWQQLLACYSPKDARCQAAALYAKLYRADRTWLLTENQRHQLKRPLPAMRINWEQRDREYLEKARQLHQFFLSNPFGSLRSRNAYIKQLANSASVEKNLYRLPLLAAFLSEHAEKIFHHQIRRLNNAFNQLQQGYSVPARWRMLRLAGLSENRLTIEARVFLEGLLNEKSDLKKFP